MRVWMMGLAAWGAGTHILVRVVVDAAGVVDAACEDDDRLRTLVRARAQASTGEDDDEQRHSEEAQDAACHRRYVLHATDRLLLVTPRDSPES